MSSARVWNPLLGALIRGGSLVGKFFGKQLERVMENAMQRLARELRSES